MSTNDDYFFRELEARLGGLKPGIGSYQTKLYKLLKTYLYPLGLWKTNPRGVPFKAGEDERRNPKLFTKKS